MEIRQGISVSPGIVVREAFVLDSEDFRIPERLVRPDEVESEIARFERARLQANDEIQALQPDRGGAGREIALLFKFHQLVLEDAKILDEIVSLVRGDLYSAEYATSRVFRKLAKQIRSIPDPYLRERDVDIHDIEKRILRQLLGAKREGLANLTREVVVVAKDLTPSQLAGLDKSKVVGFATEAGGKTSHTAIVARTMGIPGVVGLEDITADVSGGDTVVIDGTAGRIIINPDPATLERYSKKEAEFKSYVMELGSATRSLPAETLDGHEVTLLVNIELPSDIEVALANGADGVGLYRTEFIYLQYVAPTEEDHLRVYSEASRRLEGRPLVIRTLDFGADKFFDENELSTEKNPFLGCRSIRLCFEKMDVFKTQLRAILRASHGANVKIMFPMISSRTELLKAKGILDEMKEELDAEGVPYDRNMEVGIMIEVPSAALTADLLAKEVDFFSIGTNDLIQYCLAVDRVNEKVANLYQPANPAIVRLIRRVLEAGEREGVKVSMCGEMSGDENFTLLLLGLGLREFSVNPAGLPRVKQIVRGASMVEARQVARKVLAIEDPEEAMEYLAGVTAKIMPRREGAVF